MSENIMHSANLYTVLSLSPTLNFCLKVCISLKLRYNLMYFFYKNKKITTQLCSILREKTTEFLCRFYSYFFLLIFNLKIQSNFQFWLHKNKSANVSSHLFYNT